MLSIYHIDIIAKNIVQQQAHVETEHSQLHPIHPTSITSRI